MAGRMSGRRVAAPKHRKGSKTERNKDKKSRRGDDPFEYFVRDVVTHGQGSRIRLGKHSASNSITRRSGCKSISTAVRHR